MGQEGLSPFRPADYRFSSCASKPYQLGDQVQERRCEDDFDGGLAAVLFLMLLKGMPSLFIIISSIESIAKKKLKKKTVLPRRVIPSPGIEAYNDSARTCAAFEYSCQ